MMVTKPRVIHLHFLPCPWHFPACISGQLGPSRPHPNDYPEAGVCQGKRHTELRDYADTCHPDAWVFLCRLQSSHLYYGTERPASGPLWKAACANTKGYLYVPQHVGLRLECGRSWLPCTDYRVLTLCSELAGLTAVPPTNFAGWTVASLARVMFQNLRDMSRGQAGNMALHL